ncbi:MAG TPA: 2-oxoglutarate dehydrogenase complex dihydrolipoyllysine-residue succinyltransferase [Rubrobacteraceae bacterium]|nr:2-oxoglutarate dehydrogenase complex dihydrolipoyllysine-residue succinyltransferase [Rubrobacteraceae bacterium]
MPVEIHVPELGESVTDATVGRWLKSEGDRVTAGEPVVELETDKINFEVEAEQDGVLVSIAKGEGETVGVGEVIGTLGDGAAPEDTEPERAEEPEAEQPQGAEPKVAPEAQETEAERTEIEETANGHREEEGVRASPSVRRLAREYDIDLAGVAGSGSGGRITKDDVERLIREQHSPAPERQPAPEEDGRREERPVPQEVTAPAAEDGREERVRMSRRRQTIAQRLVEAQQTAAMLTTFNEADMSAIMELRRRRKDKFQERHEVRLGFMSFFTKAAIGALKAFPKVNSELRGNELVLKHYYDIGVAVNTEEGLVVPVVRDADRKSFAEVERDIANLGTKARDGKLTLEDLSGGTFTITNGGVFGSLVSTPILNVPQVAILGMHKTQDRPVAVNGKVEIRPMMYLALSYDHRIVDGADAVSFLVRVKELVEDPESLLLEG